MSYTFKGDSCTITHNGDLSGPAQIIGMTGQSIVVDAEDLLRFAADFLRLEKISELETAHWRDILGYKP